MKRRNNTDIHLKEEPSFKATRILSW